MGEYANSPCGKHRIKLGTCENLYYVTRADVEALASKGWKGDGGNSNLRSYLSKPFRLALDRFNTVAGDLDAIGNREPWDSMGENKSGIPIPVNEWLLSVIRDEIDHTNVYHHVAGCNMILPCPYGPKWAESGCRIGGGNPPIRIIAEGAEPRRLIFGCPFCGRSFNLHGHAAMGGVLEALEHSKPLNGVPDRFLASLIEMAKAGEVPIPA